MKLEETKTFGNYWYVARTSEQGRYYPFSVTLNNGIHTVEWTRNFMISMVFPSEFAAEKFAKRKTWYGDLVEVVHVSHGTTNTITKFR